MRILTLHRLGGGLVGFAEQLIVWAAQVHVPLLLDSQIRLGSSTSWLTACPGTPLSFGVCQTSRRHHRLLLPLQDHLPPELRSRRLGSLAGERPGQQYNRMTCHWSTALGLEGGKMKLACESDLCMLQRSTHSMPTRGNAAA